MFENIKTRIAAGCAAVGGGLAIAQGAFAGTVTEALAEPIVDSVKAEVVDVLPIIAGILVFVVGAYLIYRFIRGFVG
jgi:hypothetical protein